MPDPQYNNKYDKQFAENKNISDETKMMYDHFVNTSTSGVFYMPEGITFDEFREETGYNPMSGMDFNQRLSDSQGAVEQFTKGVGGLLLRLPGSAIRSVGSLFELDALYDDDIKSIGNWATELGDAMVEGADDLAGKIYTEKPGSFNPSDFGWWMEGTRSMSDTVALMGLGYLTGGLGFATAGLLGAGEAAAGFVGGVTAAMASRMSEGLGNSAQTKKETYDRMIALGADESVAKQEALKAAQNHFIATAPLIAIDFFQFSKAFNVAGKTGAKALAGAGKEAAEQATKSSLMKGISYVPKAVGKLRNTKVGGYLDNAVGEAIEEGWQEATGVYIGDQTIQGSFDGLDIRGFWDKTKDAMSDDRTLTAALQGAVGGIMMESSSPLVRNVSDFYKAKSTGMTMDQVKDAREKIATVNYLKNVLANDKKRNEAQAGSDIDHQNKQEAISRARLFQSMIDRYERDGNFDGFNKELDAYLSMAEDSEAGQKLRDDATKISKKNDYSSLTGQYDSVKQMKEEAVEIQKKIEESKKENSKPENSHIDQVSMNAAIAEDHLREWLANKDFETLNKKKAETTNAVDAVVDAMGLDPVQSDLLKAELIAEINHDGDSKYTPMLDDIYNGDNFKKLKEQLKEHYEDISKLKSRHQTSKFRSASVKALMTDLKTVSGSFNKLLDDAAFILGTKDSKGKKSKDASYDPQDIETLHERISAFNGSIIKSKLSNSQQKALGDLIDSILDTENLIDKRRKFLKKNSELEARYRGEYMELLRNDTFKILTLLADIESEIDKAESEKEKNKLLKKKKLLEDDLKKISEVYKNLESLQTQEDKDKTRIQNELRNNEGTSTPSEVSNDVPVSEEPSTTTDEEYEDTIDEDPLGFTIVEPQQPENVASVETMEGSVLIGVNSFKLKIKLDNVINEFFSKIKSRKQKNSSLRKADVKVDIYKNDDGGYEMLIYQGDKSITVDIPLDANGLSESDVDALLKSYGNNITATLIADVDGNVNSISINRVKVARVRKKKGSKVSAPVDGDESNLSKKKEVDYSEENNEKVTAIFNELESEREGLHDRLKRLQELKEKEEYNAQQSEDESFDDSQLSAIEYEIEETQRLIAENEAKYFKVKEEYDLLNPYQDKEKVRQPYQDLANYIYRAEARGEGPVYGVAKIFGIRESAKGNKVFQFVVTVNGVDYFGSSMNIKLLGKEGEGSVLSEKIKDQMDKLTENEVTLVVQKLEHNEGYPAVDLGKDSGKEGVPVLTNKVTTYNIALVNKGDNTLFTSNESGTKFTAKLLNDDIYYQYDPLTNEYKTVSLIDQSKEAYEKRLNEEYEKQVNKQNEAKKQEGAKPFDEDKLKEILSSNGTTAAIFKEIKAQNDETLTNEAANLILKGVGTLTNIILSQKLNSFKARKEGKLDNNVSSETFSQEGDTVTNKVDKVIDLFNKIEAMAIDKNRPEFVDQSSKIKNNGNLSKEIKERTLENILERLNCI
jgi:hypothetical protein